MLQWQALQGASVTRLIRRFAGCTRLTPRLLTEHQGRGEDPLQMHNVPALRQHATGRNRAMGALHQGGRGAEQPPPPPPGPSHAAAAAAACH
mmetsp:Transcript_519/g.1115  ORF Transcript_519/g.1115 Transcript_519/m.1115 type:complete len:92 (+) Transcript_519:270-545(+)